MAALAHEIDDGQTLFSLVFKYSMYNLDFLQFKLKKNHT